MDEVEALSRDPVVMPAALELLLTAGEQYRELDDPATDAQATALRWMVEAGAVEGFRDDAGTLHARLTADGARWRCWIFDAYGKGANTRKISTLFAELLHGELRNRKSPKGEGEAGNWTPKIPKSEIRMALGLRHRQWSEWLAAHAEAVQPANPKTAKHISVNLDALSANERTAIARQIAKRLEQ